ncbi:hypothetical protein J4465_02635 [Candidatus Pacearchaeota archaeon]|nr:hypothetical protein [Candidatus Pacearchaeota archaeon]
MVKRLEEFSQEIKNSSLSSLIRKLAIIEARQFIELNNLPKDGQIHGDKLISYEELTKNVCSRHSPYIEVLSREIDTKEKEYLRYTRSVKKEE